MSMRIRFILDLLSHCYTVYSLPKIVHIKTPITRAMIKIAAKSVLHRLLYLFYIAKQKIAKSIILLSQHPVRNQLNFLSMTFCPFSHLFIFPLFSFLRIYVLTLR